MIYDTICLYVCCTTRAQFLGEKNAPLDHPDFVCGGGGGTQTHRAVRCVSMWRIGNALSMGVGVVKL
jgi:hypothetical protein